MGLRILGDSSEPEILTAERDAYQDDGELNPRGGYFDLSRSILA